MFWESLDNKDAKKDTAQNTAQKNEFALFYSLAQAAHALRI